jgi:hypothetical protein
MTFNIIFSTDERMKCDDLSESMMVTMWDLWTKMNQIEARIDSMVLDGYFLWYEIKIDS